MTAAVTTADSTHATNGTGTTSQPASAAPAVSITALTTSEAVTVTVTVNGQAQQVPAGTDLAGLIALLGSPPQALATAVNGEFVARGQRAQCLLHEGDAVFTFQPITGG